MSPCAKGPLWIATRIRLPNLRLRTERFEEWCTARDIPPGDQARAKFIGISRPQLFRLKYYGAVPGPTFIAAACLAFSDQSEPGETFHALFEIIHR